MNQPLLEVTSIEKEFESVKAVDRLSFHVQPGEIFALLGPNGAGKTTVVRMLLRILQPDCGTIRYCLNGTSREKVLPEEIGYLPEERGLYREISVHKNLAYMGILRGMRREEAGRAVDEWLARLDLRERKNEKLDQLSKGNQQKVQFKSTAEKIAAGLVISVMLFGIFVGSAYQFVAITGEKQLRVTEMIVSAVTPQQWIDGKIHGSRMVGSCGCAHPARVEHLVFSIGERQDLPARHAHARERTFIQRNLAMGARSVRPAE